MLKNSIKLVSFITLASFTYLVFVSLAEIPFSLTKVLVWGFLIWLYFKVRARQNLEVFIKQYWRRTNVHDAWLIASVIIVAPFYIFFSILFMSVPFAIIMGIMLNKSLLLKIVFSLIVLFLIYVTNKKYESRSN